MNAKEFVKKHGWEAVINAVNSTTYEETAAFESKDVTFLDENNPMLGVNIKVYQIPYLEVKTLVDAYELVEKHGGINGAIEATGSYYIRPSDWEDLNEAIKLVESVENV